MNPLTERLKSIFELKVTLGNIISIVILLAAGYAGYVELRTNHFSLDRDFRAHQAYDDKRFQDFSTKEAREMRDKWVDDSLREILARLKRIEELHVKR